MVRTIPYRYIRVIRYVDRVRGGAACRVRGGAACRVRGGAACRVRGGAACLC